jgi:serine/threonine protein kinase
MQLESITRDRYQIKQVIKESYSEHTYLVEDRSASNEQCILKKFIPVNNAAAVAEATFQSALEQLKNLHHPQIERIKDYWSDNDQLFIVFSHHDEQSYQHRLQSNSPLSETEAIALLNSVLPVISYLHNRQIFHGNIAPDNLIENQNNSPVLSNFQVIGNIKGQLGIQPLEQRLSDKLRTLPLGYISPGKDEDLYALAVTVIMLLTGKDIATLFNYQNHNWNWENYKLVSDRLTDVLDKMLSSQPNERYSNAESILQALNSASTPIVSPAPQLHSPPSAQSPSFQQPPLYQQPQIPPAYPINQTPSPTNTYHSPASSTISPFSLKDWHKAVLIGGGIGLVILLGLIVIKPLIFSESEVEDVAPIVETVEPDVQREPPSEPVFTEQEATDLINNWQNAKQQMFAPPFDRQLLEQFLTGKEYENNVGSQTWLQNNNAHYTYGVQSVDSIEEFIVSGDRATLDAVITEQRTFYMNNKVIYDSNTSFDTRLVRYNLVSENGQWKIEEYNTVKKIKTR